MHWACTKISASAAIPDASLLEILLEKVSMSYLACIPDPDLHVHKPV